MVGRIGNPSYSQEENISILQLFVARIRCQPGHQHTGGEMEVLTTVGEQIGCVLTLARMGSAAVDSASHVELALSGR